jgi:uncharacterized protein (TIGR03067 family)
MGKRPYRVVAKSLRVMLLLAAATCLACREPTALSRPREPIKTEPLAADTERTKFQGSWKHLSIDLNGRQAAQAVASEFVYHFEGNNYTNTRSGRVLSQGTFSLDPTKSPPSIDLSESTGVRIYGIYRFDGDKLTLCLHEKQRPTDFESRAGQVRSLVILKRMKPK